MWWWRRPRRTCPRRLFCGRATPRSEGAVVCAAGIMRPIGTMGPIELMGGRGERNSTPDFGAAELCEEQLLERGVGKDAEEIDAAALAVLAQALAEIADRLLVGLEPEFAKGHLLHRAGLRIHQPQIP